MAWNLSKDGSRLAVYLDGQEGKQDKLKKAWKGPAGTRFVIKEEVGTSPKFKYELKDPESFGRIVRVSMQIHQEFEGDFSHLADFVVYGKDNSEEAQMRPEQEYDLGNLTENFKVMDHRGNPVEKVDLVPGKQYRVVLTVQADKSETILVEFKTS